MPRAFPHQLSWLIDHPVRGSSVPRSLTGSRGRLHLFDIQPEMLAKARARLEARGLREVQYTAGPADGTLPFGDASFDVAVLVSVVGETPKPDAALGNVHRVLKPTGTLAIHEGMPGVELHRVVQAPNAPVSVIRVPTMTEEVV